MNLSEVGREDIDRIFAMCSESLVDPPERDDLERALFDSEMTVRVRGDPGRGVVATAARNDSGYIRLLAVHPSQRGRGLGRALVSAAEGDLGDFASITVGSDAPDYLWPGVDISETPAISLLEKMGYAPVEVHYNMSADLAQLPPDPGGAEAPEAGERQNMEEWLRKHWPNWVPEAMRGFDRGDFLVARDEEGIAGFSAWNVNRRGWFGPTAVRPELIGKGHGRPLVIRALHAMKEEGIRRAEIAWVGPHHFYSRVVGARIHRAFWVMRKNGPRQND